MQNVSTRARFVANIFDILAWVVLAFGALTALFFFVAGLMDDSFGTGLAFCLGTLVYTAVAWASVSLASIVAGYIEQRA